MSITARLSTPKDATPTKGTAGMPTQVGGAPTTVSALMEAGKAIGNDNYMRKKIG